MNLKEKILAVKLYCGGNSLAQICDTLAGYFPERPDFAPSSLNAVIERFENSGSVEPLCTCARKRKRAEAAAAPEASVRKLVVLAQIEEDPSTSTSTIERETGIYHSTVARDLKQMGYKSFKKHHAQKLKPENYFPCMEFCEGMLERIWADRDFLRNICFTDECSFGLTGGSNRQNDRI
ncbi:hypothetical protein Zmor_027955 [Zophobas morio]|uniref:DUF4817 domain-containing protein n=1 Tax=Zophobas morio TaxID=2755281 RepID=A0AA38HP58_9CUCU|nr:hypothetical protein Zmor_027955 [Zophobas morio]